MPVQISDHSPDVPRDQGRFCANAERSARFAACAAAGMTQSETARACDVTLKVVMRWASWHKVPFRLHRVMAPDLVTRISDCAARGMGQAETARALGVGRAVIRTAIRLHGVQFARHVGGVHLPRGARKARDLRRALTPAEWADYAVCRKKGQMTVAEALVAIRRADLVPA